MKRHNRLTVLSTLIFPLILTSCLKTAEEIQRDQEIEQALVSTRESNSLVAEITAKNKELQEQMSMLQGRVDEVQQKLNAGTNPTAPTATNTALNSEQFLKLVADVEELKASNAKLQKNYEDNQEYLKKLDSLVKSLTTVPIDATSYDPKSKNKEITIDDAEKYLAEKKYQEVLTACKELLNAKITDGKKNRCRFAQGLAYKELKQFDEGLLSLSQIYTDWPKSSLAPNALLEIAQILQLKGQNKESQLMLKKLISEYPKTSASKDAKKLIQ